MNHYLIVGIGGACGAIARAMLGGFVLHRSADWRFPLSTFCVNVLGCLVAGALAGLIKRFDLFSPETRVLLFTGLLGGFTTFSAFGLETVVLLRQGAYGVAMGYIVLSFVAGIGALWLAMASTSGSMRI
ncbi:fluoride efflux transporter CrcB [soil metagenome]